MFEWQVFFSLTEHKCISKDPPFERTSHHLSHFLLLAWFRNVANSYIVLDAVCQCLACHLAAASFTMKVIARRKVYFSWFIPEWRNVVRSQLAFVVWELAKLQQVLLAPKTQKTACSGITIRYKWFSAWVYSPYFRWNLHYRIIFIKSIPKQWFFRFLKNPPSRQGILGVICDSNILFILHLPP